MRDRIPHSYEFPKPGARPYQRPGTIIEARSEVGDNHEAQLCLERTGMLTIPLHVPALSAKAGGLSGSNMGRSVGTINAHVVAERSTKDAMGVKNGTP